MAQLTIDLSGHGGLAPTFAGDLNSTSASPNLRYIGDPRQFADGIFDPLRVQGYMSPANNTYTALTGTIASKFVSAEYSSTVDTVYLAQNGVNLSTVSGLSGTTITSTATLTGQSFFKDLELYQINGQESLFYAYTYADSTVSNQTGIALGFKSVNSTKGAFQLAAQVFETGAGSGSLSHNSQGIADGTAFSGTQQLNRRKLAQKFRTQDFIAYPNAYQTTNPDPEITGLRLRLLVPFPTTAQTWTLKVGIQGDSGGNPDGSYITNASVTVAASTLPTGTRERIQEVSGDYGYIWFQFPATVTLSVSTTYHIVIEPTVDASTIGANQGVLWLCSDTATNLYANGSAEWDTVGIVVSTVAATDVVTITTPSTLATAGIVQFTHLKYTSITTGGLVNGTTYIVGSISGQTFKLYPTYQLDTPVNITVDLGNATFDIVPGYPPIAFDAFSSGSVGSGTSLTFNSATTAAIADTVGYVMIYGAVPSTVTWGGVAMTQIASVGSATNTSSIYSLANPGTGVKSVAITWVGSTRVAAYAATYNGALASPDTTVGNTNTNVGDTGQTPTTTTDKCLDILFLTSDGAVNQSYVAGANVTLRDGSLSSGVNNLEEFFEATYVKDPAGAYVLGITRNGGGSSGAGIVSTLAWAIKPANSSLSLNANPYWNSEAASYDFAIILNQYNGLVGPTILNPINEFQEPDDASVFLHSAQNGFLYLFTNNRVSRFDGDQTGGGFGTFTPDVLRFPATFRCTDAVDLNSLVYIAIEDSTLQNPENRTFPAGQIGVYAWDYQSILINIRNYYPAPGARNIRRIFVNAQSQLRLITTNENGFTEVRGLSNGQFQVLFTLGLNAYPSKRDSFGYMDNMNVWIGADGYQYLLGQIRSGSPEELYKVGNVGSQATGTLTPGPMLVGNSTSGQSRDGIFIAYDDTGPTANKLVHWYPHGVGTISSVAQIANIGNVYTLAMRFPSSKAVNGSTDPFTLAKVNYIRLYHAVVTSGIAATVYGTIVTYLNQSTTAARTDNITGADIQKGYMYIKLGQALLSGVFMVQFKISWSVATTLSTSTDWMPRAVEINYDEIDKLF